MTKLSVEVLNPNEIESSKKFLFEVYAKQLNWLPPQPNPSGWSVKKIGTSEASFIDDYDQKSIHFTIYDQGKIVAGARVIDPIDNLIELERYQKLPSQYKKAGLKIREFNRICLDKNYINSVAIILLAKTAMERCLADKIDYLFLTAQSPSPKDICMSLGFQVVEGMRPFRYFTLDTKDVETLVLDLRDTVRIEGVLSQCRAILQK